MRAIAVFPNDNRCHDPTTNEQAGLAETFRPLRKPKRWTVSHQVRPLPDFSDQHSELVSVEDAVQRGRSVSESPLCHQDQPVRRDGGRTEFASPERNKPLLGIDPYTDHVKLRASWQIFSKCVKRTWMQSSVIAAKINPSLFYQQTLGVTDRDNHSTARSNLVPKVPNRLGRIGYVIQRFNAKYQIKVSKRPT